MLKFGRNAAGDWCVAARANQGCASRRCDCESVAKRGSRLVGLDSMRQVRDKGSDWLRLEQPGEKVWEAQEKQKTRKEN